MEVLRYGYSATTSRIVYNSPPQSPRKDARRRLNFGPQTTCSREANNDFLQSLMSQMANSYRQKWEFDFEAGQPLPSSSNSRFQYKPLDSTAIPSIYSPLVHSTSLCDEESLSDTENCCVFAPMNLNRLSENRILEASVESVKSVESLEEEFVLPNQSPKKVNASSLCSTPKKRRDITDYIPYRSKRLSLVDVSKKESPFKSPRTRQSTRSSPYRRHSIIN